MTSLEFNGASAAVVDDNGNRLVIGFHGFQEGDKVVYSNGGSGENIGGLENFQTVYVVNPVKTSIQLAESPGGRPIDLAPALGGDRHRLNPQVLQRVSGGASIEFAAFSAVDGKLDKIVLPLHPFSNAEEVIYTNAGAGPDVFGLMSGASYFVVDAPVDGVKLAASLGGTAIDLEHDEPLSTPIDNVEMQIADGDARGVLVRDSDGSTDVVEGGRTDSYTVVLTAPPEPDETVTISVNPRPTLASTVIRGIVTSAGDFFGDGFVIDANVDLSSVDLSGWTLRIVAGEGRGQTRRVLSNGMTGVLVEGSWSVAPDTTSVFELTPELVQVTVSAMTLTFDESNWFTPQTVTVSAIDDGFVDGGDIQAFAPGHADVSLIRGPLIIDGGVDPRASTDIPEPIRLAGETNLKASLGAVESATNVPIPKITVQNDQAFQDLLAAAGGDLTGFTIEITDGPGRDQTRLIISRVGNELTLDRPWVRLPGVLSRYAIERTNPNLLAVESEEVDRLAVHHRDSFSDDIAVLTDSRLIGLGMGPDKTVEFHELAGGITYRSIEDLRIELGSGADQLTIEGTHRGETTIDLGPARAGSSTIQTVVVRTIAGHTTILGGPDDDVVNAGTLAPNMGGLIDWIGSLLAFDGGGGNDALNVDDSGDIGDNLGTLTETTLTGLGMPAVNEFQFSSAPTRIRLRRCGSRSRSSSACCALPMAFR